MDETILVPSPNWFEVSILGVASNGWVVYGGPNKSLVALEPLPQEYKGAIAGDHRYKAHVATRAHKEKISCVDISPDWPEKRHIITGSTDGSVKEWSITKEENNKCVFKTMQTNSSHIAHKEEVASVGYSSSTHVISIGSFGIISKWELASNLVKTYPNLMHNFRATCMSCSPHLPFHVAVGTKQGVIFVLDLSASGKVLFKVRGQDDDITQLSWCPQFEVNVIKSIEDSRQKKSFLAERLEKIRNEPEPELETSGLEKKLPDDSFDASIVQEDDTFDIYKDHEAEEFGHKKYVPEEIYVKQKAEPVTSDFLEECEKLKADILKKKQADEQSLTSLVEAMEKADVNKSDGNSSKDEVQDDKNDSKDTEQVSLEKGNVDKSELPTESQANEVKVEPVDANTHINRHLLASIGKFGSIRIWSKTGKVLASCSISGNAKSKNYKQPQYCTVCWYKPDCLLFSDGKNQLLECNPLHVDSKSKLTYKQVQTEHRRGLYCIMTDAPRVQTPDLIHKDWTVWTVAQDRLLVKYSHDQRKVLARLASCGGHLYEIRTCPYDVGKIAVAVGDGAVRVWETHPSQDNAQLMPGIVVTHWQHVLGKVVTCAWHPDKESLLAFATAESRVGLLEAGGKGERAARVLRPGLSGGVYSACWPARDSLLAAAAPHAALYHTAHTDAEPSSFPVVVEGQKWAVSAVTSCARGVVAGSAAGGVALLTLHGDVIAAKFVCSKMVQTIDWHPQQTSSSDTESQYKDLCAVCSLDRDFAIVVIQLADKEDGGKQFADFMTLRGHTEIVYKVYWSPHHDEQLLSTSNDSTVRIWNAIRGECLSIFPGHGAAALSAAWAGEPGLSSYVLSGGADCCMRLWDHAHYPPDQYQEVKVEGKKKKKRAAKKKKNKEEVAESRHSSDSEQHSDHDNVAADGDYKIKLCKKFLLPLTSRQINVLNVASVTSVIQQHFARDTRDDIQALFNEDWPECDVDFLKLFGSINSLNQMLDMEAAHHLSHKNNESYIMLQLVRGHIDPMVQFAAERDLLDPFLLNMTLCVSVKCFRDVTKLYTAQLDRLAAKGEEDKITEVCQYGGVPYRKLAALLSIHDVMGALDVLKAASLYKEAYVLSRIRHMDSVCQDILRLWAADAAFTGNLAAAAVIHLALGDVSEAATTLRRSTKPECLTLAAALAKVAGLPTFADFMEIKAKNAEKPKCEDTLDDLLEELPTKMELLLKETQEKVNGDADIDPE